MSKLFVDVEELSKISNSNEIPFKRVRLIAQLVDLNDFVSKNEINGSFSLISVQTLPEFNGTKNHAILKLSIGEELFRQKFDNGFQTDLVNITPQLGDPIDIRLGIWHDRQQHQSFEVLDISVLRQLLN